MKSVVTILNERFVARYSFVVFAVLVFAACFLFLTQANTIIQPVTTTMVLTEYSTITEKQIITSYSTLTETSTTTLPPITKTTTTTLIIPTTITSMTTQTLTIQMTATLTMTKTVVETKTLRTTVTLQNISLRDPTWQELIEFLKEDKTNTQIYRAGEFDCSCFALTLNDRAIARGFRCAYVEIEFINSSAAHALNAFQTSDKGLVFVDVTGSENRTGYDYDYDKIAYLRIGEQYGAISLDAVRWRYISTFSYRPDEFWKPLIYVTHPENSTYPLTYDYYIEWQARVNFLYDTIKAYKAAVEEYNRRSGKQSYEQLKEWRSNIDAIEAELGTSWHPMGIVKNIEVYWFAE